MELIIISGRSGSGKSVALHVLEDLGYYCIDNIPLSLAPYLIDKLKEYYKRICISVDVRNVTNKDIGQFDEIINRLKEQQENYRIIFLDANDNELIKRFSETRRRHPLTSPSVSLKEALQIEKKRLQHILERADVVIDTSELNVHQLSSLLHNLVEKTEHGGLTLLFQSFAYKFGVPVDTDFVFDVRCLPNPYWDKQLRNFNGKEKEIIEFLDPIPEVNKMFSSIKNFLDEWIPAFEAENRKYLTVAIGCTGGQHRSVYFAERLKNYFATKYQSVSVRHRDLL